MWLLHANLFVSGDNFPIFLGYHEDKTKTQIWRVCNLQVLLKSKGFLLFTCFSISLHLFLAYLTSICPAKLLPGSMSAHVLMYPSTVCFSLFLPNKLWLRLPTASDFLEQHPCAFHLAWWLGHWSVSWISEVLSQGRPESSLPFLADRQLTFQSNAVPHPDRLHGSLRQWLGQPEPGVRYSSLDQPHWPRLLHTTSMDPGLNSVL